MLLEIKEERFQEQIQNYLLFFFCFSAGSRA